MSRSQGCLTESMRTPWNLFPTLPTIKCTNTFIDRRELNVKPDSASHIQGSTTHCRAHKGKACLWGVSSLTWDIIKGSENPQNDKIATTTKFSNSFFLPLQTQIDVLALTLHSFSNHFGLASTSFTSPTWPWQRKPVISRPSVVSTGFTLIDVSMTFTMVVKPSLQHFSPLVFMALPLSWFSNLRVQIFFLFVISPINKIHSNSKTVYIKQCLYPNECGFLDASDI